MAEDGGRPGMPGRAITLTVFTVNGEKIAAIDIIDKLDGVAESDLAILDRSAS